MKKQSNLRTLNQVHFLKEIIFLLLFIVQVLNPAFSRVSYSQTRMSVQVKDASLSDLFIEIEQNSPYVFIYEQGLDMNAKVSITASDQTIAQILDRTLPSSLSYSVNDNQVVVTSKEASNQSAGYAAAATSQAPQNLVVKGKVTEKETGQPAIGVAVVVKGTTNGGMTSMDGNYEISNVPKNATLVFSSIGKATQEVEVNGKTVVDLVIAEDNQVLDQVVVVGYGSAKAKDLTAPITVIKAEAIASRMTSSPMGALQGKVAGLQIINSGAPGSSPTVRIRGVGSVAEESKPLYVVDGMFYDDISFLNNNDIEDMTILKDASSSSIYGVRASNGVIIISTKKGSFNATPTVTYNGSIGLQAVTQRLKMANTAQYVTMTREQNNTDFLNYIRNSVTRFGGENGMPSVSTDWYNELLRTAMMHNHDIGVNGGTEKTAYSLGINYLSQEGVMDVDNKYTRFNTRMRGDFQTFKWLKLGASMVVSNASQTVPEDAAWGDAYKAVPFFPVYDEKNTKAFPVNFATPKDLGLPDIFVNPFARAYFKDELKKTFKVLPSFYADLSFIPNKLTFKTSYSQDVTFTQGRKFTPFYFVGTNQTTTHTNLEKTNDFWNNYIWDNVLTYRDQKDKHTFSGMLGHSVRSESWRKLKGTADDVPGGKEEWMYISQGKGDRIADDDGSTYLGVSFFGRATYDYDGRYLLSATFRADGSSKYQEKWGYFPSVGAAWVITKEDFFKNQQVFDNLKVRAGWGKMGNDKVAASDGFSSIVRKLEDSEAIFNDINIPGYTSTRFFSWLKWEVTNEWNLGFDYAMLNNRLRGEVDYFRRTTNSMVFNTPIPNSDRTLAANGGSVRNSGVEISLNWTDAIGTDFTYNIGGNISFLKNKIINLNGIDRIWINPAEFQRVYQVDQSLGSFYGYKVVGVYQTSAEIASDPIAVKNKLEPGDFKYIDLNGDGDITPADRQIIGSYIPKVTLGFNLGFQCKDFDFGMILQGKFGYSIANQKRWMRQRETGINYDNDLVENRWTGPNSSNTHTSAKGLAKSWNNNKFNTAMVENASTLTIQNVQVGYTFRNMSFVKGDKKPSLRISLMAERPLSFFSYKGFTTDITDGLDMQVYPLAAIYSFGVKLIY